MTTQHDNLRAVQINDRPTLEMIETFQEFSHIKSATDACRILIKNGYHYVKDNAIDLEYADDAETT